jgi:mannose-6-phosphate isomerase-like protein (cupin superfamily)
MSGMYVVNQEQLPFSNIARELVGADHGGLGLCLIFVNAPPGRGPSLHKHDYDEVFITLEGQATVVAGDEERVVGPGDVAIIPAGTPHKFVNSGDGPLRQIDIHLSPQFGTAWLNEP